MYVSIREKRLVIIVGAGVERMRSGDPCGRPRWGLTLQALKLGSEK